MTSNVLFSTLTSSTGSVAISASLAGFALGTLFGSSKEPFSRLFVQNQGALTSNATNKIPNRPLTRTEVEEFFKPGSWQRDAYDDYTKVLLDDDLIFPCIYATKGYKADDQVYTFIDSDDLSDQRHIKQLAHMLSIYLPTSRSYGPNTSLVLLAKKTNSPRPMDEYNDAYWKMLDGIAKLDPKPWPENVPKDIDTDKWCLCFAGEAMFSVIQTPAHQVRRSRHAPGVTIVFQPKWIFDVLFSSEAKRAASLGKVRALLKKYDPIPVSPELKNYGDEGSREAQQYFLLDENIPAACPFSQTPPVVPGSGPQPPAGQNLTPQQRQQIQQQLQQQQQQQQQIAASQVDPVMQQRIADSHIPVDIAFGSPNNITAHCVPHKLEKCDDCGLDFVHINRLSRVLAANPNILCPPPPQVVNQKLSVAVNATKEEGNTLFRTRQPEKAVAKYTQATIYALQRAPWEQQQHLREELSTMLSNRSAAFLEGGDLVSALTDAEAVIQIKRPWSKGHFRKARALMALKRPKEAKEAIQLGLQFEPTNMEMIGTLNDIDAVLLAEPWRLPPL